MRDVFRPNQLIEIELNTSDYSGQKECYASRIEEVLSESLIIAAPIRNGQLVHMTNNELLTLRLHLNGVLYSAICRVEARINRGVPIIKITRPDEVSRVQLRSWVRIELLLPIGYRMAGYPVDFYSGVTSDLSGGGLMMVTQHPIDLDTLLDLQLNINDDFCLECQARVARCFKDETNKKRYRIGVRFEQLEDATVEKIIAFIFQKQREGLKKGKLKY